MSAAKHLDIREVLRRPLRSIGMDRGRAVSNANPTPARRLRARQVLRTAMAEKYRADARGQATLDPPRPMQATDDHTNRTGDAGRFAVRPKVSTRHNPYVDAGWWPHSADLDLELAQLLASAQEAGFDAGRVTYRLGDPWIAPPSQVLVGGRRIKLSGYHNHRPGMITLVDGATHEVLEVMVVPPDTEPAVARLALQMAADSPEPKQGTEILVMAGGSLRRRPSTAEGP